MGDTAECGTPTTADYATELLPNNGEENMNSATVGVVLSCF
jgi:hypothetical protein